MIKSFEHKGLQAFFEMGSKAGIQPHHAQKLARQLARLHTAKASEDMNLPGWRLHPLQAYPTCASIDAELILPALSVA